MTNMRYAMLSHIELNQTITLNNVKDYENDARMNLLSFSLSSPSVIVMGAIDDLENCPGW